MLSINRQWGLVNFDASSLWVRDRTSLTNALDITPEYLRTKHGDAGYDLEVVINETRELTFLARHRH